MFKLAEVTRFTEEIIRIAKTTLNIYDQFSGSNRFEPVGIVIFGPRN